jgi:hypothetical protein
VTAADVPAPVVAIGKSAKDDPAGTVTLDGVDAMAVLELESETTTPPALVESQTRPVTGRPPFTSVGATVTEVRIDDVGVSVRVPYCERPANNAVMRTNVVPTTGFVVTGKVALREPAGMVMFAGTVVTGVFALESVTRAPPAGATPLRMTVPVDGVPP